MHCILVIVMSDLRVSAWLRGRTNMQCFLVAITAIGEIAIRSIVLSSRLSLFHLGKWIANKSAEFLKFFVAHPPPIYGAHQHV